MNTPLNPTNSPQSTSVEVLYGPWHGQRGLLQQRLTPEEWLIQLLQPDQYGDVLLALQDNQFRFI